MRDITYFSNNVVANFDNSYENMLQFNELLLNAAHNVFTKYTKDEVDTMIRNQFDKIMGGNFAQMTAMKRRQAWREHGKEVCSLIEDVLVDRMTSGWDESNARFMDLVEEINLALDDQQTFYVEDNSLLQVSQFAGDHHDIVRQAVKPGKAFTVDTSWYTIKVYTDFESYRLGKFDFAGLVDRIARTMDKFKYDAMYTAFLSIESSLPTDMVLSTPVTAATKDSIVAHAELVKSVTGYDVMFVGSKVAISKLQGIVNYNIWSESMKDELHQNGVLAKFEGYECLALPRVNATGTRTQITRDDIIYIVPIDPSFKPIKRVIGGDVMMYEAGFDGSKKDMTVDVEVAWNEGVAVVVNELFGAIKIQG